MVGTCIGAGDLKRALRAAWLGAAIGGVAAETVGLLAAAFPGAWMGLFSTDPVVIAQGSQYLRIVGPFYGFFGVGMVLYFASQGAGRMAWPLLAGLTRLTVAGAGGWLAFYLTQDLDWVFAALACALVAFGLIIATAVARGAWVSAPHSRPT